MMKIIFTVLFMALVLSAACEEKNEIKAPGVTTADSNQTSVFRPDQKIKGATIALYTGRNRTTNIKADSIEKYIKLDSTNAWGLHVRFFNKEGIQTSYLLADSGMIRENANWMVANGQVIVTSEDSTRLETEQLFWYGGEELIKSDSFVVIIYNDGDTLMGYGLETDRGLNHVKIKRQVSGTMKDAEEIRD
jgi:LPS export ABC transporter protein LptC